MSVKVVDISSWTNEGAELGSRLKTSSEMAEALSSVGMVVVTGHGVSPVTLNALKERSMRWFMEAEAKTKGDFIRGPYGCEEGGYTTMGVEAVAASIEGKKALDHIDAVESFVFRGQPSSKKFPDLALVSDAEEYYSELVKLLRTIHAIICHALGVAEDYFYSNDIIPATDIHSLKLSHYPPPTQANVPASAISRKLRYGAHTDFQDVTILRPDVNDWTALSAEGDGKGLDEEVPTRGGLQVLIGEAWEAVVIDDDDALCVNLGDFWETWSNGRFRSPLHRVTASGYPLQRRKAKFSGSASTSSDRARFSAIFFSVPKDSAIIKPLPGTTPTSASATYEPMTAGEHLAMKLARINS